MSGFGRAKDDVPVCEAHFNEFDPREMDDFATVLLIGMRKSGKSVATRDLLWYKRKIFKAAVAFAPSEEENKNFEGMIPDLNIFENPNMDTLKQIFAYQTVCNKEGRRFPLAVIFDDCAFDSSMFKHPLFVKLFKNGRHYQMCAIVALQYIYDVNPVIRSNSQYIFVFNDDDVGNVERIRSSFFGRLSKQVFPSIFESLTPPHQCIVRIKQTKDRLITSQIQYFRATERKLGSFRLGSKRFWRTSLMLKDPAYQGTVGEILAGIRGGMGKVSFDQFVGRPAGKQVAKFQVVMSGQQSAHNEEKERLLKKPELAANDQERNFVISTFMAYKLPQAYIQQWIDFYQKKSKIDQRNQEILHNAANARTPQEQEAVLRVLRAAGNQHVLEQWVAYYNSINAVGGSSRSIKGRSVDVDAGEGFGDDAYDDDDSRYHSDSSGGSRHRHHHRRRHNRHHSESHGYESDGSHHSRRHRHHHRSK